MHIHTHTLIHTQRAHTHKYNTHTSEIQAALPTLGLSQTELDKCHDVQYWVFEVCIYTMQVNNKELIYLYKNKKVIVIFFTQFDRLQANSRL